MLAGRRFFLHHRTKGISCWQLFLLLFCWFVSISPPFWMCFVIRLAICEEVPVRRSYFWGGGVNTPPNEQPACHFKRAFDLPGWDEGFEAYFCSIFPHICGFFGRYSFLLGEIFSTFFLPEYTNYFFPGPKLCTRGRHLFPVTPFFKPAFLFLSWVPSCCGPVQHMA